MQCSYCRAELNTLTKKRFLARKGTLKKSRPVCNVCKRKTDVCDVCGTKMISYLGILQCAYCKRSRSPLGCCGTNITGDSGGEQAGAYLEVSRNVER